MSAASRSHMRVAYRAAMFAGIVRVPVISHLCVGMTLAGIHSMLHCCGLYFSLQKAIQFCHILQEKLLQHVQDDVALQMENSMTGESQDPEGATAEQTPAASQEDGLATAVAHMAGCVMADLLDPAQLLGKALDCLHLGNVQPT